MRPLSPLKFFVENKKKAAVSFIVLIFTVCAISLISVLINSLTESVNAVNLKPMEHFSVVTPVRGEYYVKDNIVDQLKADKNIEKLIPIDSDMTSITLTIGGNTTVPVMFMEESNFKYLLDKTGDYVKEGTLPKNGTKEVAVHWRIMANRNWKVGDKIGNFIDEKEFLTGEYVIVGKIDGPSVVFVGTESFKQAQLKQMSDTDKPTGYLVFPQDGKREIVNEYIDSISKTEASTSTYLKTKEFIDEIMNGLNSTVAGILIIVIFILSISVGALMYVIYVQRSDEFGILYAVGFKRGFIRNMIIKEIMSLNIISWIIGFGFSLIMVYLLNLLVYNPKGDILSMLSGRVIINTLIIPVMTGVFSILPIVMKLRKWDPVAVIERRE